MLSIVLLAAAGLGPLAWAQSLVPDGAIFTADEHAPLEVVTYSGSVVYLVTFEGGAHLNQIHPETGGLVPGTPIRFASNWLTLTSGPYANNPSVPTIAVYHGFSGALVNFEQLVGQVGFHYASAAPVTLEAFDSSGTLVASVTGAANLQSNGFTEWDVLGVDMGSDVISYVRVTGAGGATGIDDFTACQESVHEAEIDLHPDNYPNETDPYNTNSNKPVDLGLLSTASFDATTIDVSTALLGDPSLAGTVAAQSYWTQDLNGDGLLDLVINFGTARDFDDAGALDADSTEVLFTALTLAGDHVTGMDSVTIVGN